jgi:tRNA 2-thiouridine synthesizing protein A
VATIDARGLVCPLPLAMAKRKMADLLPGSTLIVLATDPEAPIDIGAWARREGYGYIQRDLEGWCEFELVKRGR